MTIQDKEPNFRQDGRLFLVRCFSSDMKFKCLVEIKKIDQKLREIHIRKRKCYIFSKYDKKLHIY